MRISCGPHLPIPAVTFLIAAPAEATTIKVLWTAGTTDYNANIAELATEAATFDPSGDGALDWSLTMWDPYATPAPDFSAFDVLVVGSTYGIDQTVGGSNGFFDIGVSARGVLENKAAIKAARGSRTFITGQDPDLRDLVGPRNQDDGPKGFLINAVNWAASGSGLGIVSMVTGWGEAFGFSSPGGGTNRTVFCAMNCWASLPSSTATRSKLAVGQENTPVNEGLTSAGLSNWITSAHAHFDLTVPGYTAINLNPDGKAITILTAGKEGAGTSGGDEGGNDAIAPVPLPAGVWLMLSAVAALGIASRRRPSA